MSEGVSEGVSEGGTTKTYLSAQEKVFALKEFCQLARLVLLLLELPLALHSLITTLHLLRKLIHHSLLLLRKLLPQLQRSLAVLGRKHEARHTAVLRKLGSINLWWVHQPEVRKQLEVDKAHELVVKGEEHAHDSQVNVGRNLEKKNHDTHEQTNKTKKGGGGGKVSH